MPKHPRKRQRTSGQDEVAPAVSKKAARLEMLMDDESKDDEERRLESLLFGVKYVPKGKGKMASGSDTEEEEDDDEDDDGARGMQHLLDQDVRIYCCLIIICIYLSSSYFSSTKALTPSQLPTLSLEHLNPTRTMQEVRKMSLILALVPTPNPLRRHHPNGGRQKNPLSNR